MRKLIILLLLFCFAGVQATNYRISKKGELLIKKEEGCVLKVDPDKQIGYGHLLKKDEHYRRISKAKAEQLFRGDIKKVNESVNRLITKLPKVPYSQSFVDGLGSLVYNCGEAGVEKSTFFQRLMHSRKTRNGKKIYYNDFMFSAAAILSFKCNNKKYSGLKKRRVNEYHLIIA